SKSYNLKAVTINHISIAADDWSRGIMRYSVTLHSKLTDAYTGSAGLRTTMSVDGHGQLNLDAVGLEGIVAERLRPIIIGGIHRALQAPFLDRFPELEGMLRLESPMLRESGITLDLIVAPPVSLEPLRLPIALPFDASALEEQVGAQLKQQANK